MASSDTDISRTLVTVACDGTGAVYGVTQQDNEQPSQVVVLDIRQELVTADATKATAGTSFTDATVTCIVKTNPSINFEVKAIKASKNGHYLALSGYSYEEDGEERAVLALVDLHGGRPVMGGQGQGLGLGVGGGGQGSKGGPARRLKQCPLYYVDQQLYLSRPGLAVHQMDWHPHSDAHLCVLTSDNRWRVYSLQDLAMAEQTFHLSTTSGGATSYSLLRSADLSSAAITAFAFGPAVSWGLLSVFFLAADGALYALCPVSPFGMRLPQSTLQQLSSPASRQAAPGVAAWLELALGLDAWGGPAGKKGTVLPHLLDGAAPALQGPLNLGSESLADVVPSTSPAVALCTSSHVDFAATAATLLGEGAGGDDDAGGVAQQCLVMVASGTAGGQVYLHAMQGVPGPAWVEGAPRCVMDESDTTVVAASYDCSVVPPVGPPGAGAGAGGASSSPPSPLLLLDLVDLGLPPLTSAPDPDSASEDDDDDEGSGGSLLLILDRLAHQPALRLALGANPDAPQQLWAWQAGGCWNVAVPWLGALARALAQSPSSPLSAMDSLPPPAVHCMMGCGGQGQGQGPEALQAGCVVQDVFVGNGALLLQGGQLHFFKPRSTQLAAAIRLAKASSSSAAPATASTPATAGKSSPGDPQHHASRSRQELVEGSVAAIYGDLLAGPPKLTLPKPQGPCGSGDPEGLAHLTSCIQALRQAHVEYCHRVAQDLGQRRGGLEGEARQHAQGLQDLQALASQVVAQQAGLQERLRRAQALHRNLADRAGVLSQLHWSLPRPLSEAERQLGGELQVLSSTAQVLQQQFEGLRKRAVVVMEEHSKSSAAAAAQPGSAFVSTPGAGIAGTSPAPGGGFGLRSLSGPGAAKAAAAGRSARSGLSSPSPAVDAFPPAQLAKVQAVILEQYKLIHQVTSQLKAMEVAVREGAEAQQGEGEAVA